MEALKTQQHSDSYRKRIKYTKLNIRHPLEEVFTKADYHIEQPFFQIFKEGYKVVSFDGQETFYAERHRNYTRRLMARIAGFFSFLLVSSAIIFPSFGRVSPDSTLFAIWVFAGLGAGYIAFLMALKALSPKRLTRVYQGESAEGGEMIFEIAPSSGIFFFNREYFLQVPGQRPLIVFRRPFLDSIFRIRWNAYTLKGQYLFSAQEDSLFLAILRRYLHLGKLIPLQFKLRRDQGKPFGTFKRSYSIRDKYKLAHDSSAMPSWIMIATAILLDTGEER